MYTCPCLSSSDTSTTSELGVSLRFSIQFSSVFMDILSYDCAYMGKVHVHPLVEMPALPFLGWASVRRDPMY